MSCGKATVPIRDDLIWEPYKFTDMFKNELCTLAGSGCSLAWDEPRILAQTTHDNKNSIIASY
jgi:hypothetical protein